MVNNWILHTTLVVCALSFLPQGTEAVRCYECTSTKACNDEFNPDGDGVSEITELPGNLACLYCMKVKVETLGSQTSSRACVSDQFLTYQTGCFTQYNDNDVKSTICYCEGDNCNHSDHIKVSMVLMTMLSLVHLIYRRF